MEDIKKIPAYQLIALIIVSKIMHEYSYLPIIHTTPDNHDAWIQIILAIPYTVLICLPILILLNKFRMTSFYNMVEIIWGKVGSKIVVSFLCLFFLFCDIACLSLAVVFIKNHIFFNTPTTVIMFFMLVPAAYIALKGIQALTRISVITLGMVIATVVLFFILGFNQMDFSLLQPILLDNKFVDFNAGAFVSALRYSDILLLGTLYFHLQDTKKINKVFGISLLAITVIIVLIIIPVITVLGINLARICWAPYYMFTRQVNVYDFIQRVEVFNFICWLSGTIVKLAAYTYLQAYYIAKVVNLKSYKPLVYVVIVVTFALFIMFGFDKSYVIEMLRSDKVFPWLVSIFIIVLPIITLIIYLIRKKKIDRQLRFIEA